MRDMSDAKPHLLSRAPVRAIELPQPPEGHRLKVMGFVIQILDDLVGALLHVRISTILTRRLGSLGVLTSFRISNIETPPFFEITTFKSRVEVFNWKTGATHAVS